MRTTDEGHCEFQDDLPAYIDRALDEGRRMALDLHLSSCQACQAEIKSFVAVDQIVRAYVPQVEASEGFERGFLTAFAAEIPSAPARGEARRRVAEDAGFWSWFARPVFVPMSAAAVAIAVAVITWPQPQEIPGRGAAKFMADRAVAPKALEEAVAIRPAVAVDPRPTTSLANEKELPRAIQAVVQEMDGTAKPVEKKLADADADRVLEAQPIRPRAR